jgi:hypothetical protein
MLRLVVRRGGLVYTRRRTGKKAADQEKNDETHGHAAGMTFDRIWSRMVQGPPESSDHHASPAPSVVKRLIPARAKSLVRLHGPIGPFHKGLDKNLDKR